MQNVYLLSIYFVSGNVTGNRATKINKRATVLAQERLHKRVIYIWL